MNVKQFQILAEQIIDSPLVEENQQEEKLIQLADLCRFIECHKPSILIKEVWKHKINVIEDDGIRKGVVFFDSKSLSNQSFDLSLLNLYALAAYKAQTNVTELWMVFIEDGLRGEEDQFTNFIEKRSIGSFYDKIFCFDFFQPKVQALK